MTKRISFVSAAVFCFFAAVCSLNPVSAKTTWTRVQAKNFLLVGNVSEKDLRLVGLRLEQFREVFSRLFTTLNVNSPVPTTVVVFSSDKSYGPFKPNQSTAGYFQPGPDVNYITLTLNRELRSDQDPFTIIFHEYTHLLVQNTSGNVPNWFNEGLAEFYSTFSLSGDQKVVIGRPIASHVSLLRANRMLPLRTLFQVDHKSPYYNERDKQGIFYAQSWALVHYLILGKDGQRMPQLRKFVELLGASRPLEQAFPQAFAMSFENMEKELREYIQRHRYPILNENFKTRVGFDNSMQASSLTEAEAQAYLGDLLLHSNRAESEVYLQRALALNPDLAMANASLGMLRVRQGRADEARTSLERALALSSQNYLIHYYYAYALSREGNGDLQTVTGFAPETAARMRAELKRAIQLRPDFPEPYSLLAFVNLVTEAELDETLDLLRQALANSPGRNDLAFMLAQLYLRKEDFKTARRLIDQLMASNEAGMRQRAQGLLARLVSVEEQLARIHAASEVRSSGLRSSTADAVEHSYDPAAVLRESLRRPAAGEAQAQGTLARVDCDSKGITFTVKVNGKILRLRTDSFRNVGLRSFSEDAGRELTCGPRKPQNNVIVAYLPLTDTHARIDGTAKSFEFVPPDFKLEP
jgi:tetratricopeptide (TPR) repeat protein